MILQSNFSKTKCGIQYNKIRNRVDSRLQREWSFSFQMNIYDIWATQALPW